MSAVSCGDAVGFERGRSGSWGPPRLVVSVPVVEAVGEHGGPAERRLPELVVRAASEAAGVDPVVLERAVAFALRGADGEGWRDDASCRDGDTGSYFPTRGGWSAQLVGRCHACPVQAECLGTAIAEGEQHGLWGGTSGAGRRRLRRVLRHAGLFGVVGEDACLSWREDGVDREPRRRRSGGDGEGVVRPRPHQLDALDAVCAAIGGGGRCQIAEAPGSGKTHVGMWAAARLGVSRVVILVPSLGIMPQTVRVWRRDGPWREVRFLGVCGERGGGLEMSATTDVGEVAAFLEGASPQRPAVVVSTYQSSPVLAGLRQRFGLAICDEAHHLAGSRDKAFAAVVRGEIGAERVLFMTATPRRLAPGAGEDLQVVGMDDVEAFGPQVHRLTLDDAVAAGVIADYRVVIAAVDRDTFNLVAERLKVVGVDATLLAGAIAVVRAVAQFQLGSCLSFHSRVERARSFAALVGAVAEALPGDRPAGPGWSGWVRGATSVAIRQRLLDRLADGRSWGVLASARAFGEGIDVPELHAAAIVDTKTAECDVVQAIGRTLRRPGGSGKIGTILLPVLLAGDADPDDPMAGIDPAGMKVVAGVLRALRAHDESLAVRLDSTRRAVGRGGANPEAGASARRRAARGLLRSRVELWVPGGATGALAGAMALRLVREAAPNWEENFGRLRAWCDTEGTVRMPRDLKVDDGDGGRVALGAWVTYQRTLRRRGLLAPQRQRDLETLPGWSWEPVTERWAEGFAALADWVACRGDANPGKDVLWQGCAVGMLAYLARLAYKADGLAAERVAAFEALPGWQWDPGAERWAATLGVLRRWATEHGHACPAWDVAIDGVDLGRWVEEQRGAIRSGRLDPRHTAALRGLPGWVDEIRFDSWEVAARRVARWMADHGGAMPAVDVVADDGLGVGAWAAGQCAAYLQGRLHPARAAQLEGIAGWAWPAGARGAQRGLVGSVAGPAGERPPAPRDGRARVAGEYGIVFAEPPRADKAVNDYIAPDSRRRHGTYVKYVQERCRCVACKAANRDYENNRQAAIRDPDKAWVPYVPAGPARRHVEQLRAAGVGLKQVAKASGLPHGSLSKLIYGDPARGLAPSKRIRQNTAERILAVSAAQLAGGARVPAADVWGLVDELVAAGYTKTWIAAQLGRGVSNTTKRGPQVTAATARAVRELHGRYIHETPPPRGRGRPTRRLGGPPVTVGGGG